MGNVLSDLAVKAAEDLGSRRNVTGVVVIVVGESDCGSACLNPGIPLDTLLAVTMQMLGLLRADTLESDMEVDRQEGPKQDQ